MSAFEWDPLKNEEELDIELLSAAKKRQIKNILKSYVGTYDPFSELIQNSMDAVDKRKKVLNEENFEKTLWITVDIKNNKFQITDNGLGFRENEFRAFLAPDISFKEDTDSRGNKGVGATYIAYGFNFLQLGTKTPEFNFVGNLNNGRKWVDDKSGIVARPTVQKAGPVHEYFAKIDRGSTFTIQFGGENTRPKDLKYFNANTTKQWLYLLLIKTPLGNIDLFNRQIDSIKFHLDVIGKDGDVTTLNNEEAKYIYPHEKIKSSINLKEIQRVQQKLLNANRDPSAIPNKYRKLNGIYEFLNSEELKKLPGRKINDETSNLIEDYSITAYGYFCYSTSVWDQLNDKRAQLRKGMRILKGGLQLANNFMPQGDLISIPLTSNIGYQNQAHIIVHFKNADPDLGRKGFQPELKNLSEEIAVAIVNKFKKFRYLLKKDTGERPRIQDEIHLKKWIDEQEKHEKTNPLLVRNSNFFKPIHEISITSEPQSEQDAIVLFNQLIAGGVIRGIRLLATSQSMKYDGVFKYYIREPFENHEFEKDQNPLGVQNLDYSDEITSVPYILEYKYNVDALIQEFETEEKQERDINLIVSWDLGESWKRNYEVTSLLDLDNLHHRQFHGLTHILDSGTTQIQAIILKELIEYLNDVDSVQTYHSVKYGVEV